MQRVTSARSGAPPSQAAGERRRPSLCDRAKAPIILVVDDSEDNRIAYAAYLESEGMQVEQAVDGEHALFKMDIAQPHLVVMELAMPGLDGWETIRRIRRHVRTKDTPIIVLTGITTQESLDRARAVGANVVRFKPCPPEDLSALIHQLLEA
jgi:CheY-like chemotaxis protein